MSALAHSIADLRDHLLVLESWVLRNKEGLTREQARRIFQRYTTPQAAGEATPAERQSQQITQILQYMEQTTQRLDLIENDIGYIKDKVDAILKKL
ncbi:MAG: hypothetical protein KJ050_06705 [Candidatus Omnitrophica bacterium]|jgi:hypothetical protein|nr:hypothetical protein [bacterium]MBK7495604.1 hypothetical protein [Candidatus Omnitrophota bacterium]MCL4734611.1 hypothetical protein [Candidatus Omnitrophota bacterium]